MAALTFSYLNIGWLGLPLAIAIFGDTASRIIIAAYIGSSVFGNIASVAALQPRTDWRVMGQAHADFAAGTRRAGRIGFALATS